MTAHIEVIALGGKRATSNDALLDYTGSGRTRMRQFCLVLAVAVATFAPIGLAQQVAPYKVLKTARVGGEGGWDYIFADAAGRRLYIPRGATREIAATETTPAVPAVPARLTIFNLDTLEPVGEIAGVGGNGTAVDPKSGHGFTSDHPKVSMFDTKTMTLIKTIDVGAARPDGIYFDAFNQRVYVFSHPTKDATVIDAKDGAVLGTIDLGGVPEQGVADGKGMLYVVMQDAVGSVTAVDVKTTMKAVGHYSLVYILMFLLKIILQNMSILLLEQGAMDTRIRGRFCHTVWCN